MKLYYAVGSSSLTPHIVLIEAGMQFEGIKVDEHSKVIEGGGDYRAINPLGFAFVAGGGLISYGPDLADHSRRAAGYVDRILKGEKPADLPVQAPTKYDLVVNLKTAKALGLTIPPAVPARADVVIE